MIKIEKQRTEVKQFPSNSSGVPVLSFVIKNLDGNQSLQIKSLVFEVERGFKSPKDVFWIEVDGFRFGGESRLRAGKVEINFFLPLEIAPQKNLYLDLLCFFDVVVSKTEKQVTSLFLVKNFKNVGLPVEEIISNEIKILDEMVEPIYMSVSSSRLVGPSTTFKTLGVVQMKALESGEFRAITLKNNQFRSMESRVNNTGLMFNNEQVSAETIISGKFLTFRLDNGVTGGYPVERGREYVFEIKADVTSFFNFNFKLADPRDLVVYSSTYMAGLPVRLRGFSAQLFYKKERFAQSLKHLFFWGWENINKISALIAVLTFFGIFIFLEKLLLFFGKLFF